MAELWRANELYNENIAQEKREQRAREMEECDRVRAEKAEEAAKRKAQRERDKQTRDAEKLYNNCPKEASAKPRNLQHRERSRNVVQWLCGMV
jgi:hypothetical protein